MSDDEGPIETVTIEQCRENLAAALAACGMTQDEYHAYIADKCHPKCWRPEGAPAGSWHAIDLMEFFLQEGYRAPQP